MAKKRAFDDPLQLAKVPSEAARFNEQVLKKLNRVYQADAEVDFTLILPSDYRGRLSARKPQGVEDLDSLLERDFPAGQSNLQSILVCKSSYVLGASLKSNGLTTYLSDNDVRSRLQPSQKVVALDPPAESVLRLLARSGEPKPVALNTAAGYSKSVIRLLKESEVICDGPLPSRRVVVKWDDYTVAKIVRAAKETAIDTTEYTTLQYLQEHKPKFPAPIPLGHLTMGDISIFFMSYTPGVTLAELWPDLSAGQKACVQDQLNVLLIDLRSLPRPVDRPFGGVAGEGCKDQRRHLRRSTKAIWNAEGFNDFIFSNPNFGSPLFVQFFRNFSTPGNIVFPHGDVRPENIIVQMSDDDQCRITGLLDWEFSGFYPDYHDSVKSTNCLATNEDSDWYQFLPPCVSPYRYPVRWLLDYNWGRHLE
jgi:hypothetical protein